MSALPDPAALEFRRMTRGDVAEVMAIESSAYRFGWTRGIFEDCLRVGYDCWVLESNGVIVGYGVLSVAATEAHVLNVCVNPREQRRGHGRAVMEHLIARALELNAQQMWLEVRPSNKAARRLYAALGFDLADRRRGYYPDEHGREDALVLSKTLVTLGGAAG